MLRLRLRAVSWLVAALLLMAGAAAFWLLHHLAALHAGAMLI